MIPFPPENVFGFSLMVIGFQVVFLISFALINSTYRDAEIMKRIAVIEFFRVVIHVRRKKLTKTFIVDIRRGLYIEKKNMAELSSRPTTTQACDQRDLHRGQ